ncbi:MAG: glycosyltransferase [Bacteroidales bacterium]|nr:glycosyltransferase [Bacteroidales bacterium]
MKKKILFFHFDLGNGGAERVLVNLANALDKDKYDITVKTLFNYGVNKNLLNSNIRRQWVFDFAPISGINKLLTLFPPKLLHRWFIKDKYDYEIAYLEGSAARIVSGCKNPSAKIFAWIHVEITNLKKYFSSFRSLKEASICYRRFDKIACVSENTKTSFIERTGWHDMNVQVVHNVIDIDEILNKAKNEIPIPLSDNVINLCSVGRLNHQKGYDRLVKVLGRLHQQGFNEWHLYLLGRGEDLEHLKQLTVEGGISDKVTFLGFVQKPYEYISKMDLFVCSSRFEGYSTAVTESVLLGVPVITTECSGMKEILGNDYPGIFSNDEQGIYEALLKVFSDVDFKINLKRLCDERASLFSTKKLINEFESFINE